MGVLVSEPRYKFYTEQTELAKYHESKPCGETTVVIEDDKNAVYYAGAGILLGVLLGLSQGR